MSKIHKISDEDFEELIKSIALNNETIINNDDPVLIFYTIAKYIFQEYVKEFEKKIDSFEFSQQESLNDLKDYIANLKEESKQEYKNELALLDNRVINAANEYIKLVLYNINETFDKIEKSNMKVKNDTATQSLYLKLLMFGNIILSVLLLYLLL